jgi:hypothetical protein
MADWAVDRHEELGLELYISPEMFWECAKSASLGQAQEWETIPVEGEPAEQLETALREIFKQDDRHLLLLNDAGMGKTVASLQIQHLLSDSRSSARIFPDGLRRLVFHFSGKLPKGVTSRSSLPDLLHAAAELEVADRAGKDTSLKRQITEQMRHAVDYALEQNRVVVIIDAFDEIPRTSQDVIESLFEETHGAVRWIITSREDQVNYARDLLLQPRFFARLRLKTFSPELQDEFMKQPKALPRIDWRSSLQGPAEGRDEILGLPYVLVTLVRLFRKSPSGKPPTFQSPSDLFLQYSLELLKRELRKKRHGHYLRKQRWRLLDILPQVECGLGAVALSMALRNERQKKGHWREVKMETPRELREEVEAVWEAAKKRFQTSRVNRKRLKHWAWVKKFMERFALNGGSTQTEMSTSIGFRTRKILELWAARYLTVYASAEDLEEIHGKALGDPEWANLWKSVIWMPLEDAKSSPFGANRNCYLASLKLLFERPEIKIYRRPTDLMWIAEQWLRGTRESEMVDELYGHLQDQFEQMQQHGNTKQKEAIAELLNPKRYVFLRCSKDASNGDTGQFLMGPDEFDNNRTVEVTLSPFAMCKYQLTRKQARIWDGRYKGDDEVAADELSWEDYYFFMRMLGRQSISSPSRQPYYFTLPTEAQWEYACRAGSKHDFCFGNDVAKLNEYAWYRDSTDWFTGDEDPQPVGQMRANKWGLYDMHGNVWEWCWDWWGEYPKGPQKDPTGESRGSIRVLRGGSWSSRAADCRSASRGRRDPSVRSIFYGFRLALSSSGIPEQVEPGRVD